MDARKSKVQSGAESKASASTEVKAKRASDGKQLRKMAQAFGAQIGAVADYHGYTEQQPATDRHLLRIASIRWYKTKKKGRITINAGKPRMR